MVDRGALSVSMNLFSFHKPRRKKIRSNGADLALIVGIGGLGIVVSNYNKKIVKGQTIADAGGAGMIVVNTAAQGETTDAEVDVLPASHVGYVAGEAIKSYIRSTPYPVARMTFDGTVIDEDTALRVPSFSSRGSSKASLGILKPNIIGPGCSILAAWPVNLDYESYAMTTFNTLSGSSLACPHLAGIMALMKSGHPDWSPAAIKSAIMTTADQVSLGGQPIVDDR